MWNEYKKKWSVLLLLKKIILIIIALFTILFCTGLGYFHYKNISSFHGADIIDLKSDNHSLLFYGSKHSNDKTDPMFKEIEKYFYNIKPQMVLVEGDFDKYDFTNVDEAILKGESAFVTYLAKKNGIPVESVEPSMKKQFDFLLKKYDKNKVLLMYILRQIYQYQNQQKNNPMNFQQTIGEYVNSMVGQGFPLNSDEAKMDNILNLLKSYLNQNINNDNWTSIDVYSIYNNNGTELNMIYNDVLNMRNEFLLSEIEENLKNNNRVFIIMGGNHVKEEKENIKDIFSEVAK